MSRGKSGKPQLARLRDLEPGQYADFFALLSERHRSTTRDGKPFYSCRFRDAVRTVSFMVWADSDHFEACEREWRVGGYFKLRGVYGEHEKYGPQVELEAIRPILDSDRQSGFDERDFQQRSRFDSRDMLESLRSLVLREIAGSPLRKLVIGILERHESALLDLPASARHYYPFPGGWLEHTLSVARTTLKLCDHYREHFPDLKPPLNRDLVIVGAVLHDIGRVVELTLEEGFEPTIAGRMFGHLLLGRDLLRDAMVQQPDVDAEIAQMLEHLLVSYLALPEWGSPRLPVIPEVLIVHHAVDLDAKMEMYVRCLMKDTSPGPFTERDPILGRALFRDRKN